MYIHLPHSLPHYFRRRFSKQLEALYLSVAMTDFALAAVVLFEPIYLYQLGFSLSHLMMYYIVVYGLYFFLVPMGGKFVARFGTGRSFILASIMLMGYYGSLWLVRGHPIFFWVAPVFFALQKMWYWPAYHSDFIQSSDQGERGKEFSGLWSLSTMAYIVGPLVGGLLIKFSGFPALFTFVGILVILANVPLLMAKTHIQPEKFSYWHALRAPFARVHIKSTLGYVGLGEELVMMVLWPVFIYLTFRDYLSIGWAVSIATLVTALFTLYIGQRVDKGKQYQTLRRGAVLTSLVWLTRTIVRGIPTVFVSDTVGRVVKNSTFVPMTSITYERALREGQVVERSVFFEQGFAIGKSLTAAGVILVLHFFASWNAIWLLTAVVSVLYLLF
ncbi:MAG: MFS transporter [Candidatus Kerfeldbacteria bacterium]|nr:MFS transporter [Candidatus Kerfeldbacteria bacterium]